MQKKVIEFTNLLRKSGIRVSVAEGIDAFNALDELSLDDREVFRDAIAVGAAALVLAHNHPSGDPEPSEDDVRLTRRFARCGETLGIEVLDHLVLGNGRWVSLRERRIL